MFPTSQTSRSSFADEMYSPSSPLCQDMKEKWLEEMLDLAIDSSICTPTCILNEDAFLVIKVKIDQFLFAFEGNDYIRSLMHLKNLLVSTLKYFRFRDSNLNNCIDSLVMINAITADTGDLLKECYTLFEEADSIQSKEKDKEISTKNEKEQKIYWLVLFPLYNALLKICSASSFEKTMKRLDLVGLAFAINFQLSSKSLLEQIVLHLCSKEIPINTHLNYFGALSEKSEEGFRELYIRILENHGKNEIIEKLQDIPNREGYRLSYHKNFQKLQAGLHAITEDCKKQKPGVATVCITESSFSKPRYLKPAIALQVLEGLDIKSHYDSFHSVSHLSYVGFNFHLKQKPSNPLMEAAIHSLTYRVAGHYTPTSTLMRFDVELDGDKKSYPVLITETIEGVNLSKSYPTFQPNESSTWALLMAILTLPGDGKTSNYIVDKQGNLICIDNDVSFVEPITKDYLSRKVNFCSIPFCLFPLDTQLDLNVIQKFISLDSSAILSSWLAEIAEREQEYLNLFSREERDELFSEDADRAFTPRILFKEGVLSSLQLQFWLLQQTLSAALQQGEPICAGDLLKQIISSKEEPVGSYIHKAYNNGGKTPNDILKNALSRQIEASLTSAQYLQASLGRIPSTHEVETATLYSINQARDELFAISFSRTSLYGNLQKNSHNKMTLRVDLFKLSQSPQRQELVIEALIKLFQETHPKPKSIKILNSSVLNSNLLAPFLHEKLEELELKNCANIDNSTVRLIQEKCPKLKQLNLAYCEKVSDISSLLYKPLEFPALRDLDLRGCPLYRIKIKALSLQTLKFPENFLRTGSSVLDLVACNDEKNISIMKHLNLAWGTEFWKRIAKFEIDSIPSLPNDIGNILNSPCPYIQGKKVKETHRLVLIKKRRIDPSPHFPDIYWALILNHLVKKHNLQNPYELCTSTEISTSRYVFKDALTNFNKEKIICSRYYPKDISIKTPNINRVKPVTDDNPTIACCIRFFRVDIDSQQKKLTEMIDAGFFANSYFHGTTSHVLKVFDGILRTAKNIEKLSITSKQSGEGDFFSSGGGSEKEYIALGLSSPGLALGLTYAKAHEKYINYNPGLYTDEQLETEIRLLDIIISNWDESLNQVTEDIIGLRKSLEKFINLSTKLKNEQTTRASLNKHHSRRIGALDEDSPYPILFEISTETLTTETDNPRNPRPSFPIKNDELIGRPMGGERLFRGNINLKAEGCLKSVFVPREKITFTKTLLLRKGFEIEKIEFFAIEALTDDVLGKNRGPNEYYPDLGAYGTKLLTEDTMQMYERMRPLVLQAYGKGMEKKIPVNDALIQSFRMGAWA